MPQNDTLLRALLRQPTPYTPIWIMRQAGRYLPEYNKVRKKAGCFLQLCKTPELATEVTLQPLARFPLDAAILFSDILTIPDAMGLGLDFLEGEGPRFQFPLQEESRIKALRAPEPSEDLAYVLETVKQITQALHDKLPLIGFSGSPWTLACYMVEGRGGGNFLTVKQMAYQRPDLLHRILEVNALAVTRYLNAQIEAGVHAIMLFDSWGGILSHAAYREFSLFYMQRVLSALTRQRNGAVIPRIAFTKGGNLWLDSMVDMGADAVGIDWTIDIAEAQRLVGSRLALQGNLDPAVLLSNPATIAREATRIITGFGAGAGHVFNLGHGIMQHTPPENVAALVETVHQESRAIRYHQAASQA